MSKHIAITGIVILGALVSVSCANKSTNPDFMSSAGYRARPEISGSLFSSDNAAISNQDIERMLSGRITLPPDGRMAILHWGPRQPGYRYEPTLSRLNDDLVRDFVEKIEKAQRLRDVSMMPALLIPDEMTIPNLRVASARFQADLLLIYRTHSAMYPHYRVFKKNQVKAYTTVELVLLDVRTGTIPFSSVIVKDYTADKDPDEMNFQETFRTAEMEATNDAMAEGASDLVAFLDAVP